MAPLKLGVLVSGSGSNLQAIIDAIGRQELNARIQLVISNEPGVRALARAEAAGIASLCIAHRDFSSREAFDQRLIEALTDADVEWVVLAGFMRLLTPGFLDRFEARVLNIHPALLPAFPGAHAIRQALEHGVKVTGCSVHLVDKGVDSGPILAQAPVPIHDDDTEETLAARIHAAEHRLYVGTLCKLAESELVLKEHPRSGRVHVHLKPRKPSS